MKRKKTHTNIRFNNGSTLVLWHFIVCWFVVHCFLSLFVTSFPQFLTSFRLFSFLPTYFHIYQITIHFFLSLQYTVLLVIFTLGVCRSAVLKSTKHSTASIDPVVAWRLTDVLSARQRRSPFTVNPKISTIAAGKPSFTMTVRLFGKTQSFLQIAADGTVNGTSRCASKYGKRDCSFLNEYCSFIKLSEYSCNNLLGCLTDVRLGQQHFRTLQYDRKKDSIVREGD